MINWLYRYSYTLASYDIAIELYIYYIYIYYAYAVYTYISMQACNVFQQYTWAKALTSSSSFYVYVNECYQQVLEDPSSHLSSS